jgi:hypothetical protein
VQHLFLRFIVYRNNKRFMGSSSGDPENMPDKHKFNKKQKPNPMQKGDSKAKK